MRRGSLIVVVLSLLVALPATAAAHTLSYSTAKRAAAAKGTEIAHQPTTVKHVTRLNRHRYEADAIWNRTDPVGCKLCGQNRSGQLVDTPTTLEYCVAELTVKFRSRRSRRVVVSLDSRSCS